MKKVYCSLISVSLFFVGYSQKYMPSTAHSVTTETIKNISHLKSLFSFVGFEFQYEYQVTNELGVFSNFSIDPWRTQYYLADFGVGHRVVDKELFDLGFAGGIGLGRIMLNSKCDLGNWFCVDLNYLIGSYVSPFFQVDMGVQKKVFRIHFGLRGRYIDYNNSKANLWTLDPYSMFVIGHDGMYFFRNKRILFSLTGNIPFDSIGFDYNSNLNIAVGILFEGF